MERQHNYETQKPAYDLSIEELYEVDTILGAFEDVFEGQELNDEFHNAMFDRVTRLVDTTPDQKAEIVVRSFADTIRAYDAAGLPNLTEQERSERLETAKSYLEIVGILGMHCTEKVSDGSWRKWFMAPTVEKYKNQILTRFAKEDLEGCSEEAAHWLIKNYPKGFEMIETPELSGPDLLLGALEKSREKPKTKEQSSTTKIAATLTLAGVAMTPQMAHAVEPSSEKVTSDSLAATFLSMEDADLTANLDSFTGASEIVLIGGNESLESTDMQAEDALDQGFGLGAEVTETSTEQPGDELLKDVGLFGSSDMNGPESLYQTNEMQTVNGEASRDVELPFEFLEPEPAPSPAPEYAPAPEKESEPVTPEIKKMSDHEQYIEAANRMMESGDEMEYKQGFLIKYFLENVSEDRMTPRIAAAYVGNFMVESPNLNPGQHQYNGGPGRGIAQWEAGGRFDHPTEGLLQYANSVNRNWDDLETQAGFVVWEITNGGYETQMHNQVVANSGSLNSASDAVVRYYERAGAPAWGERQAASKSVANNFNKYWEPINEEQNALSTQSVAVPLETQSLAPLEAEAEPTTAEVFVPETPGEMMATKGGSWVKAGTAMDYLVENDISPRLASAVVGNLLFEDRSSRPDGYESDTSDAFGLRKGAFEARYNHYGKRYKVDTSDLNEQLKFIVQDLKSNPNFTFLNETPANIDYASIAVRKDYLKPTHHEDADRIAQSQQVEALYESFEK